VSAIEFLPMCPSSLKLRAEVAPLVLRFPNAVYQGADTRAEAVDCLRAAGLDENGGALPVPGMCPTCFEPFLKQYSGTALPADRANVAPRSPVPPVIPSVSAAALVAPVHTASMLDTFSPTETSQSLGHFTRFILDAYLNTHYPDLIHDVDIVIREVGSDCAHDLKQNLIFLGILYTHAVFISTLGEFR